MVFLTQILKSNVNYIQPQGSPLPLPRRKFLIEHLPPMWNISCVQARSHWHFRLISTLCSSGVCVLLSGWQISYCCPVLSFQITWVFYCVSSWSEIFTFKPLQLTLLTVPTHILRVKTVEISLTKTPFEVHLLEGVTPPSPILTYLVWLQNFQTT